MTTRRGFIAGVVGLLGSLPFIRKSEARKSPETTAPNERSGNTTFAGLMVGTTATTGHDKFTIEGFDENGQCVYFFENGRIRRAYDGNPFPYSGTFS